MRSTTAGIVAIVAFLLAGSADAQSLEEQSIRCMSASSGIAIAGCTAVIESALGTGSRLGDAFNNRGIAYAFSAEELERSAEQRSAIATAPVEIVRFHLDYDVNADGSNTQTREIIVRILTQQGLDAFRAARVGYTDGFQRGEIVAAYTIKPDGRRVDVPSGDVITLSTSAPGYQQIIVKGAPFRNLEIGDRVGMISRIEQRRAWFKNEFYADVEFLGDAVAHDVQITLSAPSSLLLKTEVNGLTGGQTGTVGRKTRWVWRYENNMAIPRPADSVVTNASVARVAISSFRDYSELAAGYRVAAEGKATVTPAVQSLADQLTAGVSDRKEQARRLYEWVSSNITSLSIPLGDGGFTPHSAADVLARRLGDCKDHVVLLQALLAAKRIQSTGALVYVGNRYEIPTLPGTSFNHEITYIPEFDLYLDATTGYAPFGSLPSIDLDKPVLLLDSGQIGHTPSIDPGKSTVRAVSSVQVDRDGNAYGESQTISTGTAASDLRAIMNVIPAGREQDFLRVVVGPTADVAMDKGDFKNATEPYAVRIRYRIQDAMPIPGPGAVAPGMTFNLFSFSGAIGHPLPTSRRFDYACTSFSATGVFDVVLPDTVEITAVPRSGSVETEDVSFSVSYDLIKKNALKASISLRVSHPHAVCGADYYDRVRSDLARMVAVLGPQILYRPSQIEGPQASDLTARP